MTPLVSSGLKITVIGLLCVFCIVAYGTYRCKTTDFTDPLTFSLFPAPLDKYLDGWGISHYLFFTLLGYLFPEPKLIAYSFFCGVLWEIVEFSMKDKPFYISKCNYTMTTDKGEGWWYGRWQDLVMNSLGLWTGYYLSKKFKNSTP